MNIRSKAVIVTIATIAGSALANPVNGIYVDGPDCDINGQRQAVEELGTIIFPADELVSTSSSQTTLSSCASDDPTLSNFLVTMTNLTGKDWTDLFYVADVGTTISNADGEAASAIVPGTRTLAFRIDSVGSNTPLVFESMGSNGIFEAGETWQFILQDYTNAAGGPPEAFSSFDFAGASTPFPGIIDSTGSIVQFLVPAPSSAALLGLGGLATLRRRRSPAG